MSGTSKQSATIAQQSSPIELWKAPPLVQKDFAGSGMDLQPKDVQMMEEFEALWKDFLQTNHNVLPTGNKDKRMMSLERKLQAVRNAKQRVEAELQRQLDFFDQSEEEMKENYKREKVQLEKQLDQTIAELQPKVDGVGTATRNLEANREWEIFLDALNNAVQQSDVKTLPLDGLSTLFGMSSQLSARVKTNVMRPSAKAMFLNNALLESDDMVNSREFVLRAYRIDNALLHAQVKVLQRDVERMEHLTETTELVGKFLTEQNIWGLLASSSKPTA